MTKQVYLKKLKISTEVHIQKKIQNSKDINQNNEVSKLDIIFP